MFVVLKCFGFRNCYKINISRCFCVPNSATAMSPEARLKEKAVHVAELLNCSVGTAVCLIAKNPKIMSLEDDDILRSTTFCAQNMRLSDVVENPSIISTPHQALNRRLGTLKELGCKNVRGKNIVQFERLIKKKPKASENVENLPYSTEALMKILGNCSLTEASEISSKLMQMHSEKCPLSAIKAELNTRYLMLLFKCSREKIQRLIKKHPLLLVQSVESMNSTLKVLIEKLGFTTTKIYHYPYLLTCQDYQIENTLERVPVILGASVQALVRKHPALLRRSPSALQKLEAVLNEFGITKKQLVSCPRVLFFSPNTARNRLQALCDSEDFVLFKTFRGFLFLVHYYKHLHTRVKLLKEANLPFSLSSLILSHEAFKRQIIVNTGQTYSKDTSQYLSEIFNCSGEHVRKHLLQFPFVHFTFFVDVCKVIKFLLNEGVSKSQLWNGLGIVACKPEAVEKMFHDLPQRKEFQPLGEWLKHPNFIQLLTFIIIKSDEDSMHENAILDEKDIEKFYDSYDLVKEFQVSEFDLESDLDSEIEQSYSDEEEEEEDLMSDAHKI